MSSQYVAEIPESEAEGTVAELYEDIRGVIGLPLVNLIYRALAVEPGRLERIWRELRPNLLDPAAASGARELVARAAPPSQGIPIPEAALAATGTDREEIARIAATLDAYGHANPLNLLAVSALLAGVPGVGSSGAESAGAGAAATGVSLLPMADLRSLAPPVRRLLEEMSEPIAGTGETVFVPSLFRHFAQNACLLALLWTVLRPSVLDGSMGRRAEEVAGRAPELAAGLPHAVGRVTDEPARALLERFARAIPNMIVGGAILRQAIDEALAAAPAASD